MHLNTEFKELYKSLFDYLKTSLFLIICCVSISSFGQNGIDSLTQKSYDELIKDCRKAPNLKTKEIYLKVIFDRAKKEKDTSSLITAHHLAALIFRDHRLVMHCDSLISISSKNPNRHYPASGYLIRGNYFYKKYNFKSALDDYLKTNAYAKSYFNEEYAMESNYYIGILKDKIGEHEEALKLHLENFKKIKLSIVDISDNDYLTYLFGLANSYNELGKIDSASHYNRLGIKESLRRDKEIKYFHFVLNEGVTQFYDQRYLRSLDSINKALPHLEEVKDKQNCAIGYFYAGKSYLHMQSEVKAMQMFKKVDSIFVENKYVQPKLRETYEILINHFKKRNDVDQQLTYITKLIQLDSIHADSEIYINKKIVKEYDTQILISEKENIIKKLEVNKNSTSRIILCLSGLLVVSLISLYFQYNRRKRYKQNFLRLLNQQKESKEGALTKAKKTLELNISQEIVEGILVNLDNFERQGEYLKHGINLNELAKTFRTNANYLSKVVNNYKKLSFINYLNNLRIDYAINQLKVNKRLRSYTISAIANDVGFSNTQSFSKAFLKKTGIKPSYFIKELEKLAK